MLVDEGEYFTINRARQYGKTTTLWNLKGFLEGEYGICLISFEGMTKDAFVNEKSFCKRFYGLLSQVFKYEKMGGITLQTMEECTYLKSWDSDENHLQRLSDFIAGMLADYEKDFQTGMNIEELSALIFEYTSGYPYLVSRICKLIDERVAKSQEYPDRQVAWTKSGFLASVRMMLTEKNTLFESLDNKLLDYPELKEVLKELLFKGKTIECIPADMGIRVAVMFGFVEIIDGTVKVVNRIFEVCSALYRTFFCT